MSVETAIVAYLKALPAVAAAAADRVYAIEAKQDEPLPYVLYQIVDSPTIGTMDGVCDLRPTRVQIDVLAERYTDAKALADAIEAAAEPFEDEEDLHAEHGVEVQGVFPEGVRTVQERPLPGEERGPPRMTQDWIVWHKTPEED